MSSCILCLDVLRKSKKVQLNEEVIEGKSVHQAIEQQFAQHYHLLHGPSSHSQCICKSCHSSLQIFYDFVNIINLKHNFPQVRIKSEKVEHEEPENAISFINFTDEQPVDLKELEINITRIKAEPDFDYDITQDPQFDPQFLFPPIDDNSDFEWKLDEEQMKLFGQQPKEPEEPKKKKKKRTSEDSDSDFDPRIENIRNRPVQVRKPPKYVPNLRPQKNKASTVGDDQIRKYMEIKCLECGLEVDSFYGLGVHFRECHKGIQKYLICCGKKFHRRMRLIHHLEQHLTQEIECDLCPRYFKSTRLIESHMKRMHMGQRKIIEKPLCVCTQCGKVLRGEAGLRSHMKSHEIDHEKTFECYICKKYTYRNIHSLKTHFSLTHNEKVPRKKKCKICFKEVMSISMYTHMRDKHSNIPKKRELCKICGHWVIKKAFKKHVEKHEAPGINCKLCGKFINKTSIYMHNRLVHTNREKTFKCTMCDKAFFKEMKLKEHVAAAHTREYLFKCRVPTCGKEFRAEGNWKMHEKRAHPEEYDKVFKPFYKRAPGEKAPVNIEEALISLNEENLMNNFFGNN